MTKKARRRAQRALPARTELRADGLALEVANYTQSVTVPVEASRPLEGYWPLMLPARCPQRRSRPGWRHTSGACAALPRGRHVVSNIARRCWRGASRLRAGCAGGARRGGGRCLCLGGRARGQRARALHLICLDLFEGGRLTPGTLARPFLRQVAMLLRREAGLTVNLMRTARLPQQLHRVASAFTIERQEQLWGNVILHLSVPSSPYGVWRNACSTFSNNSLISNGLARNPSAPISSAVRRA